MNPKCALKVNFEQPDFQLRFEKTNTQSHRDKGLLWLPKLDISTGQRIHYMKDYTTTQHHPTFHIYSHF